MEATEQTKPTASSDGRGSRPEAPAVFSQPIKVAAINTWIIWLRLVGETDLCTSPLSPAVLENPALIFEEIEVAGRKKKKKVARTEGMLEYCVYRTADGRPGFPAGGILRCVADGAAFDPKTRGYEVRGLLRIPADILAIESEPPVLDKAGVRNKNLRKGADAVVGYRARFRLPWYIDTPVIYWADRIEEPPAETVVNLVRGGGFSVGIGVHRQQCGGTKGQFDVEILQAPVPYRRYSERIYEILRKGAEEERR